MEKKLEYSCRACVNARHILFLFITLAAFSGKRNVWRPFVRLSPPHTYQGQHATRPAYIQYGGPTYLLLLSLPCIVCRVEKEKAQAKAEADDLRGQLDHISKGKVRSFALTG